MMASDKSNHHRLGTIQDSRIERLEIGDEIYNLAGYTNEAKLTELGKVITEPNAEGTFVGTQGGDSLYGRGDNDVLIGEAGNDTFESGSGDDTLFGGADNDNLYSGVGNDTLDGGAGDDTLNGGGGDDVYIVRKGEGNDSIVDQGGNDTLELHGFTAAEVGNIVIEYDGINLNFSLNDAQFLYIRVWYLARYQIETLKVIDENGNATSYNLSGYTFVADTDVRITELTKITPSLVDDGASFSQDDEALIGVTSLDVSDF